LKFTPVETACYEVWPDWALVDGVRIQVGFELDLCAKASGQDAGACAGIYENLRQIALSALPDDEGEAEFEIAPYDHSIHESPKRSFRPEIVASVRILHKHGYGRTVDDCERRCLRQIEDKLRQMEICRQH
jgi:hypothetical protein